ncbi:MAG TPA: hypothetical protein VGX21_06050 [Methylomirabilota bacterium]|nr:hypothetical protein [Methylomirabilota bacterium]
MREAHSVSSSVAPDRGDFVKKAAALIPALLVAANCAAVAPKLTTPQQVGLENVERFVEDTRRIYGLGPIRILVGDHYPGTGAVYRPGLLTLEPRLLDSQYRDAQIAHMMAYAIIPAPDRSFERILTEADWQKRQIRRSLDAYAKAVEILQRVRGWPERSALDHVSAWLTRQHELEQAGRSTPTPGHLRPCAELADLWKRFAAYTPPDSVPRCYGSDVPK